jgi:hypothetical protein
MKYKDEWKGHVRYSNGTVYLDGVQKGKISTVHREGAKSKGGMMTNTVFVAEGKEFTTLTEGIEYLIRS